MVTTIDPVVHGGRNKRYALAVVLHVIGATLAAGVFGGILGGLGGLAGAPWSTAGPVVVAIVAVAYAAREAAGVPVPIPDRRRQVPEWWRTFFSPPVAALLYGLGLGIGFLTFLTYGTFVAVSAAAITSGRPVTGALICAPFGLARGLSVLLAASSGGTPALDRLERISATAAPRLVNATALVAMGGASVLALA